MPYSNMLLRMAEPADAMAVASVHVRAWQAAYRNLMPDEYLDGLRAEERAKAYDFGHRDPSKPQIIVAIEERAILGFATISPVHDADVVGCGELCALYVDPAQWRKGIGSALIASARARLLELGFSTACLWVLEGNTRAERFYQQDGWISGNQRRTTTVWAISVAESRYRRIL